jgi:hypothetical protein
MYKIVSRTARIGEELHTVAGQLAPVSKDGESCGFPWRSCVEFVDLPQAIREKYGVSARAKASPWSGNRMKFEGTESTFEFSELPSELRLFRRRVARATHSAVLDKAA